MSERLERLLEKANQLPLSPGVYIMRGKDGGVVYVGKSKALKNRVSQYFQNTLSHNAKTQRMVEHVESFDYILTDSEMEALTLENSLIKLHTPKYNIKLKDDKNYPYIRLDLHEAFPRPTMVRKRRDDGARYFGPYSSGQTVYTILRVVSKSFGLVTCRHEFPRDTGKVRPCIYAQIGQCAAPCTGAVTPEEYAERVSAAKEVLQGKYAALQNELTEKMESAAERLDFEAAASYRDRIRTLQKLREKQKVVADPDADQDVFAIYSDDRCAAISAFIVRGGCLVDHTAETFGADTVLTPENVSSYLLSFYQMHEYIPHEILLDCELPEEDREALEEILRDVAGMKVTVRTPKRGDARKLCRMAYENAEQTARLFCKETEKSDDTAVKLASLLALEVVPERIEAYDISNFGNEAITAGMVVFCDGKPKKNQYRTFRMETTKKQDDYASMREALERRLRHLADEEQNENFSDRSPDLILVDGGAGQVSAARDAMDTVGIEIPVFGMVKDEFHKTRTLTDGVHEINIAREQSVFSLIYRIQEEVHRYTVSRMTGAKRKTMRRSVLEEIPSVGEKRGRLLLSAFGSLRAVREATAEDLAAVKGIPGNCAEEIYRHFHPELTEQNKKDS